jgi:hypothetical protein
VEELEDDVDLNGSSSSAAQMLLGEFEAKRLAEDFAGLFLRRMWHSISEG